MATNMYLKFENPSITGTGTGQHAGEIQVLSWSHGFQQATSSTRGTTGREQATHNRLSFTKYLDAASTELLKANWTGRQFAKATLRCYRADGAREGALVEYLSIVMEHVIIPDLKVTGGPGDVPVEEVSLDYALVTYHYTEQHPSGERLHSASLAKEGHGSPSE